MINKIKVYDNSSRTNCYISEIKNELIIDLNKNLNENFWEFLINKIRNINKNGIIKFKDLKDNSFHFEHFKFNLLNWIDSLKKKNKQFSKVEFKALFNKILNIGFLIENNFEYFENFTLKEIYFNHNKELNEYEIIFPNPYSFNTYFNYLENQYNLKIPLNLFYSKKNLKDYFNKNKKNIKLKEIIDLHEEKIKKNVIFLFENLMYLILLKNNENIEICDASSIRKNLEILKKKKINCKEFFIIEKILENIDNINIPTFSYIKDYLDNNNDNLNFFNKQILTQSMEVEQNMINVDIDKIEVIENKKDYSNKKLLFGGQQKKVFNLNLKNNLDPYPNKPPNINKIKENLYEEENNDLNYINFNQKENNNVKNFKSIRGNVFEEKLKNKPINNNLKSFNNNNNNINQNNDGNLIYYDPYSFNNRKNDNQSRNKNIKNSKNNNNVFKNNNNIISKNSKNNDFIQMKNNLEVREEEKSKQENIEKVYKNIINKKDKTNEIVLDLLINNWEDMNKKIKLKRENRKKNPKIEYSKDSILSYEDFKNKYYPEHKINFNEFPLNQIPNYDPYIYNNQNLNHFKYFENVYEKSKKLNLKENLNYSDHKAYLKVINNLLNEIKEKNNSNNNSEYNLSDSKNVEFLLNELVNN